MTIHPAIFPLAPALLNSLPTLAGPLAGMGDAARTQSPSALSPETNRVPNETTAHPRLQALFRPQTEWPSPVLTAEPENPATTQHSLVDPGIALLTGLQFFHADILSLRAIDGWLTATIPNFDQVKQTFETLSIPVIAILAGVITWKVLSRVEQAFKKQLQKVSWGSTAALAFKLKTTLAAVLTAYAVAGGNFSSLLQGGAVFGAAGGIVVLVARDSLAEMIKGAWVMYKGELVVGDFVMAGQVAGVISRMDYFTTVLLEVIKPDCDSSPQTPNTQLTPQQLHVMRSFMEVLAWGGNEKTGDKKLTVRVHRLPTADLFRHTELPHLNAGPEGLETLKKAADTA